MLRRAPIVALLAAAFAAAPAFASTCWHSEYVDGTKTSVRTHNSACAFPKGSKASLVVRCSSGGTATVGYDFSVPKTMTGTPTGTAHLSSQSGSLTVHKKLTRITAEHVLRITVTISGSGSVTITSASVGYYS